jgi:AAHS family 4-hydroxybenzoate transporter-like MFS transporter
MPHDVSQTVGELIDSRPMAALHLRVFLLCGAIVLLDGYDLQALGLAVPAIAHEWSIAPSALSWALSASLVGLGLASAFLAPIGDRRGRRPVLIGGLLLIGIASVATALVTTPLLLAALRFLTGAGLGVCQANATSLAVEWAPRPRRASVMTLMSCQVAVGALLAGLMAPALIRTWGWPGIFLLGGIVPLLLALLVFALLPESLALLAARTEHTGRFALLLRRFAPDVDASRIVADPRPVEAPGSIAALLGARYLPRTLAFWVIFTIAAFLVYMLISWLPVFLGASGWSRDASVRGIMLLQGGGILGALVLARFIDRGYTVAALCCAYIAAACAGIGFNLTAASGAAWPALLCLLGASVSGGMFGVLAVGALLYPPELRATGLGVGAAVARVGAVLGPLVGGWVLSRGAHPAQILAWLAVPAGGVALIIGLLRRVLRPDASNQQLPQ